jgi:hypothetical protein
MATTRTDDEVVAASIKLVAAVINANGLPLTSGKPGKLTVSPSPSDFYYKGFEYNTESETYGVMVSSSNISQVEDDEDDTRVRDDTLALWHLDDTSCWVTKREEKPDGTTTLTTIHTSSEYVTSPTYLTHLPHLAVETIIFRSELEYAHGLALPFVCLCCLFV